MGKFHFRQLPWLAGALAYCLVYCSVARTQPAGMTPDLPKACELADGSALRACARSCFPVCRNRAVAAQGSAIGRVCNDLMLLQSRQDRPECQATIAAAEKSAAPLIDPAGKARSAPPASIS